MPTQGSNIPVLTVEKLWIDKNGRGIYVHADGNVCNADTWTGKLAKSGAFLPAVSATAWLKVIRMSGTSGTESTGYIPIFRCKW